MSSKIVNDKPTFVLKQIVAAMQEKKARNIVSLDLKKIPNAVARFFVICHAPSKTQVSAIYDEVVDFVIKECGVKPFNKEGFENSEWILIDYVDIVVHIFLDDIRTFYKLEDLWADAIPKEYKSEW